MKFSLSSLALAATLLTACVQSPKEAGMSPEVVSQVATLEANFRELALAQIDPRLCVLMPVSGLDDQCEIYSQNPFRAIVNERRRLIEAEGCVDNSRWLAQYHWHYGPGVKISTGVSCERRLSLPDL